MNNGTRNLFVQFGQEPLETLVNRLHTCLKSGLSSDQVLALQRQYGPNIIREEIVAWYIILLRQCKSPLLVMFLAIALLSFLINEYANMAMILGCVIVNIIFGFYQEYRAQAHAQLLEHHVTSTETVIRDGKRVTLPSTVLVPGDLVMLSAGDIVPADMRIVKEYDLYVDESLLTGESEPVKKHAQHDKPITDLFNAVTICFAGTTVTRGTAWGLVYAIGQQTALGAVADTSELVQESDFARQVRKLSSVIFFMIAAVLALIILIHSLKASSTTHFFNLLLFATALAVSAVPEALPVVITFCLSLGVTRLARKSIIVKRLSAIEELGSITLLCVDKTGTLTENILQIASVYPQNNPDVLWYAALASELYKEKIAATAKGFDVILWRTLSAAEQEKAGAFTRVQEMPFDPVSRVTRVLLKYDEHYYLVVRGMPENVISLCTATPDQELQLWLTQQEENARRVIAVAYARLPELPTQLLSEIQNLTFVGAIAFDDPLKKSAVQAIHQAQQMSIAVKILSGDSVRVCTAVARTMGLLADAPQVMTGADFMRLSEPEKEKAARSCSVFARVLPEQKFDIIRVLKKNASVGYLGDGINDVPALRLADVSIVVSDSSDSARAVADIILLKKSLRVIIDGIYEGRTIRINTLKYIQTTLASNFGNFYALAIVSLFVPYLPMLPIQLLLLNLMTDFPLIALATDTVSTETVQKVQPYSLGSIVLFSTIMGAVSSLFDFICFGLLYSYGQAVVQSGWFVCSILTELVCIFSLRTRRFCFRASAPSGMLLLLSGAVAVATVILPYTTLGHRWLSLVPLPIAVLMRIGIIVVGYFVSNELVKWVYYTAMRWYTKNHKY